MVEAETPGGRASRPTVEQRQPESDGALMVTCAKNEPPTKPEGRRASTRFEELDMHEASKENGGQVKARQ